METHQKFTFKAEPKPDGSGWTAHCEQFGVTVEGATKEEVEEKIRTEVIERFASPALKELLNKWDGKGVHVEKKVVFSINTKTGEAMVDKTSTGAADPSAGSSPTAPMTGTGPGPIERYQGGSGAGLLKWAIIAVVVALTIWLILKRH